MRDEEWVDVAGKLLMPRPSFLIPLFESAIQLEVELLQAGAHVLRWRLPHPALHRFHQALDDAAQRPRVLLLEEALQLGIEHVGIGYALVHPVVDHLGGGVVAEQVIDSRSQLERALVAVPLDAGDPLGIDDPGPKDTPRLIGQIALPGLLRIRAVPEELARVPP